MHELFFNRDFLNRLEHLVFLSKKIINGRLAGNRRSNIYGIGVEYADHREYNYGDDIRYIDWNMYGRLGRFYTKLFFENRDININILVDQSRSMGFGSSPKLEYALKLAASLGYIGLSNLDHVGVGCFSDDIDGFIYPQRGKNQIVPYLEFLCSVRAEGSTDLNQSLEDFTLKVRRPGLVVILSDFFDENGYERGLNYLLFKRFEVHVIQILCREEIDPDINGDIRMYNIEGENYSDIDIDDAVLRRYQRQLEGYNSRLKDFCNSRGILYIQAMTDLPFDRFLIKYFRDIYR